MVRCPKCNHEVPKFDMFFKFRMKCKGCGSVLFFDLRDSNKYSILILIVNLIYIFLVLPQKNIPIIIVIALINVLLFGSIPPKIVPLANRDGK